MPGKRQKARPSLKLVIMVVTIYRAESAYTGRGAIICFADSAPDNTLVANAVLDMGTAYTELNLLGTTL
jgi:hypothetical protein